jgi:transposase
MSYKRLTELMDSLSPERRAKVEAKAQEKVEARAQELKEEFPIAAAIIGELVEERAQLQARIAELEQELQHHK